jgi:hypothetical protein
MRTQHMLVGLTAIAVITLGMAAPAQAQDPWLGTWKLNLAKSKYDPASGAPKSQTVKQEAVAGGGMKSIVDGTDAQGKPLHTEVTTMYDGKSTEVKGAPDANTTRVYKRIDSRTYEFVASVAGKVTTTARSVVAADGKTRTVTTTGKNAQGQSVNNVAVYEKQ